MQTDLLPVKPLASFLPYQLAVASHALTARIALEYRTRWQLGLPDWRVLAALGDAGQLTQRDIALRTLLDKVAVNRACRFLEERQFAARTPNANDGRSHLLSLTGMGQAVFIEIMHSAMDIERRVFGGFTQAQLACFCGILETVRQQAQGLAPRP